MPCVFCSLFQCCAKRNVEHDAPISRYYERLAAIQARGSQPSHQVLREILKEVQTNMIPRTLLKEWAIGYFPNATDFWTFRKNVINELFFTYISFRLVFVFVYH